MSIERISAICARRCREIENSQKPKYYNNFDIKDEDLKVLVPAGTIGAYETAARYKQKPYGRYRFTGQNGSVVVLENWVINDKINYTKCS